ncbi:bifunctional serine/threonine-protein kinase/formylglycine-generating enzyme family protein [Gloeocapsa sp. PCC 73106]|uniref:bifunctional serine/threonine-protein kinase/formylglycine-generating enzyme family protein n=1 Tax=Gloeocapsa sp. PCC 73106 TaxID=102232 RepID=UPI0002AC2794|nr:bifunctional serine/threonine-protein kinase/formylglycine-generating enzyme family protein [Gloeocapsa sp. PCC 73106]ELR96341.1 hypothetical protein GLO73106DRAFT_00001310 [Gloeocapsa sp. PCC 73106]
MRYCLNPGCPNHVNPDHNTLCQGCRLNLDEQLEGYQFGQYRILEILGQGGFGRTYKALDTWCLDRPCVIKKLLVAGRDNILDQIKEMFKREAQQLLELDHSRIPKLYAYPNLGNDFYLVQEYIDGVTLTKEWYQQGDFTDQKIEELLKQLVPILVYIQKKNILHRDIKPDNIMRRTKDNLLVLIDFGAARVKVESDGVTMTAIYTPEYASVEQIRGNADKSTDIYSLGVTCVRLRTGCLKSDRNNLIYDNSRNRWKYRQYLEVQGNELNPKLASILDKMTAINLEDRYQNAQELWEDIKKYEEDVSPEPPPPPPPPPPISLIEHLLKLLNFKINRLEFFKWLGWGFLGLAGWGGVSLWRGGGGTPGGIETVPPPTSNTTVEFQTLQINEIGEVVSQENLSTELLQLDLSRGVTLDFLKIPSAIFLRGSPETEEGRSSDEGPQIEVQISQFWLGKHPVTQAQYQQIMGINPSHFEGNNRPVEQVSWEDAIKFCEASSHKLGQTVRLPSEAEWEYACRGGTITPFAFGPILTSELANYNGRYYDGKTLKGTDKKETTEVGSYPPNRFGLHDCHGNVWEWCQDDYVDSYAKAFTDGTPVSAVGNENEKVFRGGSWLNSRLNLRSAYRNKGDRTLKRSNIGFRVVLVDII